MFKLDNTIGLDLDSLADWQTTFELQAIIDQLDALVASIIADVATEATVTDAQLAALGIAATVLDDLQASAASVAIYDLASSFDPDAYDAYKAAYEAIKPTLNSAFNPATIEGLIAGADAAQTAAETAADADRRAFAFLDAELQGQDGVYAGEALGNAVSGVGDLPDYIRGDGGDAVAATVDGLVEGLTGVIDGYVDYSIKFVTDELGACRYVLVEHVCLIRKHQSGKLVTSFSKTLCTSKNTSINITQ